MTDDKKDNDKDNGTAFNLASAKYPDPPPLTKELLESLNGPRELPKELKAKNFEDHVALHMTGIQVVDLHKALSGEVAETDMADELIRLRKFGLTEAEVEKIPPHHIENLRNYESTVQTISGIVSSAESVYTPQSNILAAMGDRVQSKSYMASMMKKMDIKP